MIGTSSCDFSLYLRNRTDNRTSDDTSTGYGCGNGYGSSIDYGTSNGTGCGNGKGLSPLKESISENDRSTVTTPIEKFGAIPSPLLSTTATVPTSVAIARAGIGLNALTSGKQKHSDLDNLMGEFNDLMSHLKVSVSPCRTTKKLPFTAHLDSNESEAILENSHEFLHRTRMINSGTNYSDVYTDQTDTGYNSADDSASVATIRELSAQQLKASSAA